MHEVLGRTRGGGSAGCLLARPTGRRQSLAEPGNGWVLDLVTGQASAMTGSSGANRANARLFPSLGVVASPDQDAGASADNSTVALWYMSQQRPIVLVRGGRQRSIDVPGPLQPPDPALSPDGTSLVVVCAVGGGFEALLLTP